MIRIQVLRLWKVRSYGWISFQVSVRLASERVAKLVATNAHEMSVIEGLGAVQHDALGDGVVTISVFHQLRCLVSQIPLHRYFPRNAKNLVIIVRKH